jgi:hypothetical protein
VGPASSLLFSNSQRAFYRAEVGSHSELMEFDGQSVKSLGTVLRTDLIMNQLGDRLFFLENHTLTVPTFFEIVNDTLVPLNRRINDLTLFDGEIFGVNNTFGDLGALVPFWIKDGQVVPVPGFNAMMFGSFEPDVHFTEFDGGLYFDGYDGSNFNLYAIVSVPEPCTLADVFLGAVCGICIFTTMRWRRRHFAAR